MLPRRLKRVAARTPQKAERVTAHTLPKRPVENADRKCKDGGEPPARTAGPGNAVGKGPRAADCPYKDGAKCKDGSEPPCKDGTGSGCADCPHKDGAKCKDGSDCKKKCPHAKKGS